MTLPTYRQERDHETVPCEACGDYVHESLVTYESTDLLADGEYHLSNNAEGPERAFCIGCHARLIGVTPNDLRLAAHAINTRGKRT